MRVVALTGGIGCGKSHVARHFASLGAKIIDADQLAREAIAPGTKGIDQLISTFGPEILKDGQIDRKALGLLIFSDKDAKQKLENIIHPFVRSKFEAAVAELKPEEVLIYEIPLLVETGAQDRFDLVITVESEMEHRIPRLLERGMQLPEIQARIASQATRQERVQVADFLIENDGSEGELLHQVSNIWDSLHEN